MNVIYIAFSLPSYSRAPNRIMSPKNKATARSAKKGKAVGKTATAVVRSDNEADWASEEEELSMRDMVQNLTAMMASMTSQKQSMPEWPSIFREPPMLSCSQTRTWPVMRRPPQAKGKGEPSSRVSCAPGKLML